MKKITKNITEADIIMASGFPGGINFPQNIPCPNQCKFCYERPTEKLFPWIIVKYIQQFNKERFVSYLKKATYISELKKKQIKENKTKTKTIPQHIHYKNKILYFPKCDFFSLGLNSRQIELILKNGKPLQAYTTGLNVDPELIKFFTKKYPNKFSLHLSIITFDPIIRENLMNPRIDLSRLIKISKIIKNSDYFLLFFNKKQLISDVRRLNNFSLRNNNDIIVSQLFYSKISPEIVKEYAQQAVHEFEPAINYIKENREIFHNLESRISFFPESQIFAWSRKKAIKYLLKDCKDSEDSAIFCSQGAFNIMRPLFKQAHVIPIESCYGGNIDFVLGMTVKQIIVKIHDLINSGIELKYAYLPDAMFHVSRKYDLYCENIGSLKKAFPCIKIFLIEIPAYLIDGVVTFKECVDYYSKNLRTQPTAVRNIV